MHQPVMLEETISNLVTNLSGVYVDCTAGGGGHLRRLLDKLNNDALAIALDKDKEVLDKTRNKFCENNIRFIYGDFQNLVSILATQGLDKVDGIMIDLGVSSFQLDQAERGFSFHEDAFLDMRMDRNQELDAWKIVNRYPEEEISRILFTYGEERYARRIAREIAVSRQTKEINTTLELVELIKRAVPAQYSREKHPARRSFQALRIAVNEELHAVETVLPQAVEVLRPGGRLCIISFHSLEDRIVKRFMQDRARNCICPPGSPVCTCGGNRAELRLVSRKPVIPSEEECVVNPRARSAKLRVAERI